MINVYEENLEYLKDVCYEDEVNQVLDSLIIKNSFVYKFDDLIYEFDIDNYVLYDIIKIKGYDKPVYIYSVDCYGEEFACLSQSFYIPHVIDDLDVHFVAFISCDIIEDELKYKYVLGHELSHIDFLHLDKYDNHTFQKRYHLIEAYCDVKSLSLFLDGEEKQKAYVDMINDNKVDVNSRNCIYNIKERLIRTRMMKLYMKGKINVGMLYKYIINNYERHMNEYERFALEYSDLLNNIPNIEFDSFEKKYMFDEFIDKKRYRDCF